MNRWGHGHSIGTGVLLALLVSGHLLEVVTVVFLVGLLVGRAWGGLGGLLHRLGRPSRLERERWLEVRARRRSWLERTRGLRAERDKAERAAYWRGVGDGSK